MGRKFLLRSMVCSVSWRRSVFDDWEEFCEVLCGRLPVGTRLFGCREPGGYGKVNYHVVMRFPVRVHWPDARSVFVLRRRDGVEDTTAVNISVPLEGKCIESFLQRAQECCVSLGQGVVYGERFGLIDSVVERKQECSSCGSEFGKDAEMLCISCAGKVGDDLVSGRVAAGEAAWIDCDCS